MKKWNDGSSGLAKARRQKGEKIEDMSRKLVLKKLLYLPNQETLTREHKRLMKLTEAVLEHTKKHFPKDYALADQQVRNNDIDKEDKEEETTIVEDSIKIKALEKKNINDSIVQFKKKSKKRPRQKLQADGLDMTSSRIGIETTNLDPTSDPFLFSGTPQRVSRPVDISVKGPSQSISTPITIEAIHPSVSSSSEPSDPSDPPNDEEEEEDEKPFIIKQYELSKNALKIKPILQDDVTRDELDSEECESLDGEEDVQTPPLLFLGEQPLSKKRWVGWENLSVEEDELARSAKLPVTLRISEGCIIKCACCKLIYEKTWSHPVNQLKMKLLHRVLSVGDLDLEESDPESLSAFTGVPIDELLSLESFPELAKKAIAFRLLDALHQRKFVSRLYWTRGVVYILVCAEWERKDKTCLKQSAAVAASIRGSISAVTNAKVIGLAQSRAALRTAVARSTKKPQKSFRIVLVDVSSVAIMALPEDIAPNDDKNLSYSPFYSNSLHESGSSSKLVSRNIKRTHGNVKSKSTASVFKAEQAHELLTKIGYQGPHYLSEDDEKGRCIYSHAFYPKGAFFCQYIGQLITEEEAEDREKIYADVESAGCYSYYFKPRNQLLDRHCIDSTAERDEYGIGRLLNHSRTSPNIVTETIYFDGIPHLIFIAKKDILFGDELKFDYGERDQTVMKAFNWMRK
jgi:hypothetical protein